MRKDKEQKRRIRGKPKTTQLSISSAHDCLPSLHLQMRAINQK